MIILKSISAVECICQHSQSYTGLTAASFYPAVSNIVVIISVLSVPSSNTCFYYLLLLLGGGKWGVGEEAGQSK